MGSEGGGQELGEKRSVELQPGPAWPEPEGLSSEVEILQQVAE